MTSSISRACGLSVLVLGRSSVNLVVISRIVERIGVRVRAETPDNGHPLLRADDPAVVILDGGSSNRDCDMLIEPLRAARQRFQPSVPGVILLSSIGSDAARAPAAAISDVILSKPIAIDRLQPAVETLFRRWNDRCIQD